MKILLKLVFRFEKQITEEKEINKILNSSADSNTTAATDKNAKRFVQNLDTMKEAQ